MAALKAESWERARSEEQKQKRIDDILNATLSLYEESKVADINLALIAKQAKFTRSNLYKYFESKEEIFLELIERDRTEWLVDLEETLPKKKHDAKSFSKAWVELHFRHERLTKFLTIMNTILEKNVSYDVLFKVKQKYMKDEIRILNTLIDAFPQLSEKLARDFLYSQLALTIGAYSLSDTNEVQDAVMEEFGGGVSEEYFRELYLNSIRALIESVLNRAKS